MGAAPPATTPATTAVTPTIAAITPVFATVTSAASAIFLPTAAGLRSGLGVCSVDEGVEGGDVELGVLGDARVLHLRGRHGTATLYCTRDVWVAGVPEVVRCNSAVVTHVLDHGGVVADGARGSGRSWLHAFEVVVVDRGDDRGDGGG
jgi:hypothetical protein